MALGNAIVIATCIASFTYLAPRAFMIWSQYRLAKQQLTSMLGQVPAPPDTPGDHPYI